MCPFDWHHQISKKNNINLDGATTKLEILETIGSFIPDPKKEVVENPKENKVEPKKEPIEKENVTLEIKEK